MRKKLFLVTFSFIDAFCFAQKVDIIHRSDYRHNYVMGRFTCVENATDTNRLTYIATLKIQADDYPFAALNFLSAFKREAKEIGANSYYVQFCQVKDSSITVTVRTFFAPEKFFEANKEKRDSGNIYFFSAERKPGFNQTFYLFDSMITFNSMKYHLMKDLKKALQLTGEKVKIKPLFLPKYRSTKPSLFYLLGYNQPNSSDIIAAAMLVTSVAIGGPIITVRKRQIKAVNLLSYDNGRFLHEIYSKMKS